MAARVRTKYPGVYRRESPERRFNGKPDVCFDISFKLDAKKVWEKVGWLSEGYSEKLAADIRSERLRSIRHGKEIPQQKKKAPTFKNLSDRYLKWAAETKCKNGIDDKSRYQRHLAERFDNKRLDEILPLDLERMKSEMLKSGIAPKTVSHCLGLVQSMFTQAAAWGIYEGPNPVKKVKKPKIQNARDRFLSVEEADRLLKELKRNPKFKDEYHVLEDAKLHDITLISLHTGARAAEIFKLKGCDVNLAGGLLTLQDTKNEDTRYAPMTKAVQDIVRRRMPTDSNAYIFTDRKGGRIKEVSNAFARAVDRLGLNANVEDPRQKFVFHSCRHTFASWLAIQGTPILTIARLMGHRTLAMSMRYAHLSPDHVRQAIDGIERTINGNALELVNGGAH